MRKTRTLTALCIMVLCLGLAGPAQAGNFFTGVGVGTLGVGVDLGYQFNNMIKMRINTNYLPIDFSMTFNDVEYDASIRNFTAGLLFDVHPFGKDLRLTAGAYYRDLTINLDATPRYGATIGNHDYTASQLGKLESEISWDKFAPYIGLGWGMGSGDGNRLSFDFNLGVMTLRGVDVDYKATGLITGSPIYDQLRADIDREAKKIKEDLEDWKFYPVVSLFISFRF